MSCDQSKQYLNKQLEDLEKNRGFINTSFEALKNNPLVDYIGGVLASFDPTTLKDELINKIVDQTNNPIGAIQQLLTGIFSIPRGFKQFYLYFILVNQLLPLLEKRRVVLLQIRDCLERIDSVLNENYFFRISPSAENELYTLLSLLKEAQRSLLQIEFVKVTKYNEVGEIIDSGYQLPSYLEPSMGAGFNLKEIIQLTGTPLFYFTKRAFKYLEESQRFLRNLISTKELTGKEKELLQKLDQWFSENNELVGKLAGLIPIPLAEFIEKFDIKRTLKKSISRWGLELMGATGKDNLANLNGKIGLMKLVAKDFEALVAKFNTNIQSAIETDLVNYHNAELDLMINDLQNKQRPSTLIDFFAKAPAWYARIEVIKYSLYIIDFSQFTVNIQPMGPNLDQWAEQLKQLNTTDWALELEKGLLAYFPTLAALLYTGSFLVPDTKRVSIKNLLHLCNMAIESDLGWESLIRWAPRPVGFEAFNLALGAGLNKLQTSGVLGKSALLVTDMLRTGSFLAVPAILSAPNLDAQLQILGSVGNLGGLINGAELYLSAFWAESDIHVFDNCEKLKDKNLFMNPTKDNPDAQEIVNGISDSYKELWEAIAGNL